MCIYIYKHYNTNVVMYLAIGMDFDMTDQKHRQFGPSIVDQGN